MVCEITDSWIDKISMDLQEGFYTTNTGIVSLQNGDFFAGDQYIGCVRGWGRLQYKTNPEDRQDNIANYLLNCLNSERI